MSMMKAAQLYHLHMRLCDVKQDDRIMGGVSVLLVGEVFLHSSILSYPVVATILSCNILDGILFYTNLEWTISGPSEACNGLQKHC